MGSAQSKAKAEKKKKKENSLGIKDPKHPPKIKLPGPYCWKEVPFLPESFMYPAEWQALKEHAAKYGVTPYQLDELFLRVCSPYDISLGTVQLKKFYREFDPRFRKVLRRIILKEADGHPRMLYENIVRFIFDFCGMDFFSLVVKSVKAVRDFDVMNIVTVRAIVRYINGDRDMDEFTRSVLGHIHAEPPYHHISAFVQLCVRYPVLVYPVILMQRSMQRRFFGLKFWREYMKRSGTQLLPPDFSKVDAAMLTARVLLIEGVSLAATPFQFGTPKTGAEPPKALLDIELRRRRRRYVQGVDDGADDDEAADEMEDEFDEMGRRRENDDEDEDEENFGSSRKRLNLPFGASSRRLEEGHIDMDLLRNESIAASAAMAMNSGVKFSLDASQTQQLGFLSMASPKLRAIEKTRPDSQSWNKSNSSYMQQKENDASPTLGKGGRAERRVAGMLLEADEDQKEEEEEEEEYNAMSNNTNQRAGAAAGGGGHNSYNENNHNDSQPTIALQVPHTMRRVKSQRINPIIAAAVASAAADNNDGADDADEQSKRRRASWQEAMAIQAAITDSKAQQQQQQTRRRISFRGNTESERMHADNYESKKSEEENESKYHKERKDDDDEDEEKPLKTDRATRGSDDDGDNTIRHIQDDDHSEKPHFLKESRKLISVIKIDSEGEALSTPPLPTTIATTTTYGRDRRRASFQRMVDRGTIEAPPPIETPEQIEKIRQLQFDSQVAAQYAKLEKAASGPWGMKHAEGKLFEKLDAIKQEAEKRENEYDITRVVPLYGGYGLSVIEAEGGMPVPNGGDRDADNARYAQGAGDGRGGGVDAREKTLVALYAGDTTHIPTAVKMFDAERAEKAVLEFEMLENRARIQQGTFSSSSSSAVPIAAAAVPIAAATSSNNIVNMRNSSSNNNNNTMIVMDSLPGSIESPPRPPHPTAGSATSTTITSSQPQGRRASSSGGRRKSVVTYSYGVPVTALEAAAASNSAAHAAAAATTISPASNVQKSAIRRASIAMAQFAFPNQQDLVLAAVPGAAAKKAQQQQQQPTLLPSKVIPTGSAGQQQQKQPPPPLRVTILPQDQEEQQLPIPAVATETAATASLSSLVAQIAPTTLITTDTSSQEQQAPTVPQPPQRRVRMQGIADDKDEPPLFKLEDKLEELQQLATHAPTEKELMRAANVLADSQADDLALQSQQQVLMTMGGTASTGLVGQGFSAIDTRIRMAAFGFSTMMGSNSERQRQERILHTADRTLPIPVPPRISDYVLEHPHPAGTVCKLSSLQIAKIVLAHANSGAGQLYGIVRVPCLLCNRTVLHVDDLIAEEMEEDALAQELMEQAEEEELERQEEEEARHAQDDSYDEDDDEEEEEQEAAAKEKEHMPKTRANAENRRRSQNSQQQPHGTRSNVPTGVANSIVTDSGAAMTTAAAAAAGGGGSGRGRSSVTRMANNNQSSTAAGNKTATSDWQKEQQEDVIASGEDRAEGRRVVTDAFVGIRSSTAASAAINTTTTTTATNSHNNILSTTKGGTSERINIMNSNSNNNNSATSVDTTSSDHHQLQQQQQASSSLSSATAAERKLETNTTDHHQQNAATAHGTGTHAPGENKEGDDDDDDNEVMGDDDDQESYLENASQPSRQHPPPKHRSRNKKKKWHKIDTGAGDIVRGRMQKVRAKEAEIKRRVALIKEERDRIKREDAKLRAERLLQSGGGGGGGGTFETVGAANGPGGDAAPMFVEAATEDELEDVAVKIITAQALEDPGTITLVTGSAEGAVAGLPRPIPAGAGGAVMNHNNTLTDATNPRSKDTKHQHNNYNHDDDESSYYDEDSASMVSSSVYSESSDLSDGGDSVAIARRRALEDETRVREARERLAKTQVFAKATAKNTGFCGDCDIYCRRVAAHMFGYKVAHRMLDAATVKPSVEDELDRHTQRARAEKHPLMQGNPPDDETLLAMQQKYQEAQRAAEEAAAAAAEAAENGEAPPLPAGAGASVDLLAANTWKAIERDIYEYPDDHFLELYDDESKRFFYHNVTIGVSQWHKPKKYQPYLDPEQRKEEAAIAATAQKELTRLQEFAAKAAKTKVSTSLGQM